MYKNKNEIKPLTFLLKLCFKRPHLKTTENDDSVWNQEKLGLISVSVAYL